MNSKNYLFHDELGFNRSLKMHERLWNRCSIPLSLVEVSPIVINDELVREKNSSSINNYSVHLSSPIVKLHLCKLCSPGCSQLSSLHVNWDDDYRLDENTLHESEEKKTPFEIKFHCEQNSDNENLRENLSNSIYDRSCIQGIHRICGKPHEGSVISYKIYKGSAFLSNLKYVSDEYNDTERNHMKDILNRLSSSTSNQYDPGYCLMPVPIVSFMSEVPTQKDCIPCLLRSFSAPLHQLEENIHFHSLLNLARNTRKYSQDEHRNTFMRCITPVSVVDGTVVRILPPIVASYIDLEANFAVVHMRIIKKAIMKQRISQSVHPIFEYRLSLKDILSGEVDSYHVNNLLNSEFDKDVLTCHHEETVRELAVRMNMLLSKPVFIGTTQDAFHKFNRKVKKTKRTLRSLNFFWRKRIEQCDPDSIHIPESPIYMSKQDKKKIGIIDSLSNKKSIKSPVELHTDMALIVHDPFHGSGKTALVSAIARLVLKCQSVHIINGASLFAKYSSTRADVALESILHGIVLSAALRNVQNFQSYGKNDAIVSSSISLLNETKYPWFDSSQIQNSGSVCVILDQLDSFVSGIERNNNDGDSWVCFAILAYLSKLIRSLTFFDQLPFPSKNPIYNINGKNGFIFPVRLCLVGVVTCSDNMIYKQFTSRGIHTAVDVLGGNTFRLPTPSPDARFNAFNHALQKCNVTLSQQAKEELPRLVTKFSVARGRKFIKTAQILEKITNNIGHDICDDRHDHKNLVTLNDLKLAIHSVQCMGTEFFNGVNVMYLPQLSNHDCQCINFFSSVGGNTEAKKSLEDVLALDDRKRYILQRFGFSLPTGVLLYGPPGTGKTLLGKAIAQKLQFHTIGKGVNSNSGGFVNGAFISLHSGDIIHSTVGKSEKIVVSAFEIAQKNSPSVIFIDEFETLFPNRDQGENGRVKGSSRLVSTLLQCLDDLTVKNNVDSSVCVDENNEVVSNKKRVVVVAVTNAPWMVDRSFLRPGRFDRIVYVGLPTLEEREAILNIHISKMKLHGIGCEDICKIIAPLCDGFSGADLSALCRSASVRCLGDFDIFSLGVKKRHFLEALSEGDVSKSCSDDVINKLQMWRPGIN